MATLADGARTNPVQRDRIFFLIMAIMIALTAVAGFSLSAALGHSSFDAPWWVHVHGLTFMGWLCLYLTQNALITSGNPALHRRLGWFATGYVGWTLVAAFGVSILNAINHRVPSFFEPNVFMVMDWMTVLVFAGLTWAGIGMRARTEWHRRLVLCGAMQVMTPGIGRILPLPLLGEWKLWAVWAALLPFIGAAVIYDLATRGRVHPAYYWGFGTITLAVALIRPIAFSPPMLAFTAMIAG